MELDLDGRTTFPKPYAAVKPDFDGIIAAGNYHPHCRPGYVQDYSVKN